MALVFRGNERDGTKTILILINQCVQLKKKSQQHARHREGERQRKRERRGEKRETSSSTSSRSYNSCFPERDSSQTLRESHPNSSLLLAPDMTFIVSPTLTPTHHSYSSLHPLFKTLFLSCHCTNSVAYLYFSLC